MASFDENGKYIKTNWKAGDKITATKLNKIEESIEAVNDNDISRHVEADARLDALEAKDVAHDKEFTNVRNLIADNKAAAELGDYEINSRMTFLENELNEGIEEVHNVAETVDGKIATAEANMTAQVNQGKADMEAMVAEVESDIENLLKNGLVLPSGEDDTQAIQNMLDTNKKVTLIKGVYNISSLTIPSGGQIIGAKNTTINATGEKAFYFPKDIQNLSFKNFTIQTSNSEYCFYFDGELGSVITDGVIEDVKIIGFITPVYAKYLRKFNFNRISSHCKNFMEYTGKSAEVNINNSYLVHYFDTDEDSFGIKSYAEGEYYPEGLMINNTLIYRFERNFDITDLMVGNFTNIHSDAGAQHCLPDRIVYNQLTQTITFSTCWFYSTKFEIGNETDAKSYRMNITNCTFEACEDGITIRLNRFVSDVTISNCRFIRSASASNCIGIVSAGGNNHINIHDLDFYGFISYVQFQDDGARNSVSNIPNSDNLESPFYFQHAVTTNNIFRKFTSLYIERGLNVTSDGEIINEDLYLGEGIYVCKVKMNQLNISTEGFVELKFTGDNVYVSRGEGWSSAYSYIRNREFETSYYINISNPGKVNVTFKSVEAVFTVGYHSYMEIIKL